MTNKKSTTEKITAKNRLDKKKISAEEGFNNLVKNLEPYRKVENLEDLKTIKVSLKDFDITGEHEFISISFTDEDLEKIAGGEENFVVVVGRRC